MAELLHREETRQLIGFCPEIHRELPWKRVIL